MDIEFCGLDTEAIHPDELEALRELEEEEMLRESDGIKNLNIPSSSLVSSLETPSEMPLNTSTLNRIPPSIAGTLQSLASRSNLPSHFLAQLLQPSSSSKSASFSSNRRTNRVGPPASLQEHFKRKGNLSVSDLVSNLWCEYALQYSILGMTNLKIEDPRRPTTITTPQGNVIVPDKTRALQKEKVMESGTAVHKKLEKQIAAKPVYIKTKTREDEFGLRLLKLIGSLKSLMIGGIAREVPVYGIVHEKLVFGVIDEISVAALKPNPSSSKNGKFSAKAGAHSAQPGETSSSKSPKKTWASQEEWRKEKEKEKLHKSTARGKGQKALSFSKSSSSSATTSSVKTSSSNPLSIVDDPSSAKAEKSSSSKEEPIVSQADKSPSSMDLDKPSSDSISSKRKGKEKDVETDLGPLKARFGFFLSDTKTRVSSRLPFPEDQKSARFQCMVYKRLFDGLTSGALLQSSARQRSAAFSRAIKIARDHYPEFADAEESSSTRRHTSSKHPVPGPGWLSIDSKGSPLLSYDLFQRLNLDEEAGLSESFVDDAKELWEEWDVSVGREKEVQIEEDEEEGGRDGPEEEPSEVQVNTPEREFSTRVEIKIDEEETPGEASVSPVEKHSSTPTSQVIQALPASKRSKRIRTEKVISCNLQDVAKLLDNTLLELAALAEIGMSYRHSTPPTPSSPSSSVAQGDWKPEFQGASIQTDLRLVYRLREHRGTFRRRGERSGGVGHNDDAPLPDFESSSKRKQASSQDDTGVDDLDEESQLALAIQMSLEQSDSQNLVMAINKETEGQGISTAPQPEREVFSAIDTAELASSEPAPAATEGSSDRSQTPGPSQSPVSKTVAPPSTADAAFSASNKKALPLGAEVEVDTRLLGVVSFPHNPFSLESHLHDVLDMWSGVRELRGVSEQESGRCNFCEFKMGCEWRQDKGESRRKKAEEARLIRENERWEKRMQEKEKARLERAQDKTNGMDEDDSLWDSLAGEIDEQDGIDWGAIETSAAL